MTQRNLLPVCLFVLLLLAGVSDAGTEGNIPDISVNILSQADVPVSLFCLPDGGGSDFASARVFGGGAVDATIVAVLLNNGQPVANFPFEDIWLGNKPGNLVPCMGGTTADASTDAAGETFWQFPLLAGGTLDPAAGDLVVTVVNMLNLYKMVNEKISRDYQNIQT